MEQALSDLTDVKLELSVNEFNKSLLESHGAPVAANVAYLTIAIRID